ncbi:hydrocephalus-inducing protein homolog [Haemorhous mexicanus]|uniref:hydrocephalus-inducing protein homolog n=1 Tax=Haemorhous mexicanus TaxID=30427 RepID=UPI0028BE6138|nr:hydrocephalus-inducing protein homolog [Haemorhous mexicanus]XP_059716833.1 hydrocephalus-inducing protein homolog [Haemorhous mexicanus]XP_059716834.1 hydrocephalus-inducing protein homolog [Haemorhous mexicanus]
MTSGVPEKSSTPHLLSRERLTSFTFPQVVKVSMGSSPYFQLTCSSDVFRVVPPGASAPVRIRFSPAENKDYSHELICVTERERIVVPIRAIGARAILDFPAQLDFSKCPVKCSIQKTLLVCNVGTQAACYQLSTQSPFSMSPAIGILDAGDTMQVTVGFHLLTTGDHCGSLAVCCSTGEENIHTNLRGDAVEVNAGLSTNSVELEKTFITMSSHKTMFIENRSNITAHFQWKAFPTEEGEIEEKRRKFFIVSSEDCAIRCSLRACTLGISPANLVTPKPLSFMLEYKMASQVHEGRCSQSLTAVRIFWSRASRAPAFSSEWSAR